ncbi:MAG: hypothetical protein JNK76_26810 [Planctomycetales bacterium]|nr:hypothetical protein [Planctomycetales bacterium]
MKTVDQPTWLLELLRDVQAELDELTGERRSRRPALEAEHRDIEEKLRGWTLSLGNSQLSVLVRQLIEKDLEAATLRQQNIDAEFAELDAAGAAARRIVQPDEVLARLDRLADVLAAQDPTRGNLELGLHVDRIVCRQDSVTLRMCKLGVAPEAVELLATPSLAVPAGCEGAPQERCRRRSKLRIIEDDIDEGLRAQAEFIADTHRFEGLGEQWFWTDEFQLPDTPCWSRENAEAVFLRRKATKWSYAKLAPEFGVTPPTIGAAIRAYLKAHPDETDEPPPRGGNRKPKVDLALFCEEARTLWIKGSSKLELAEKFGYSEPTINKAIKFAYEREGLKMPTREEALQQRVAKARRIFDLTNRLDAVMTELKASSTTTRDYLKRSFAAEGRKMPDLREKSERSKRAADQQMHSEMDDGSDRLESA